MQRGHKSEKYTWTPAIRLIVLVHKYFYYYPILGSPYIMSYGPRALGRSLIGTVKMNKLSMRFASQSSVENAQEFASGKPFKKIPGPSFLRTMKDYISVKIRIPNESIIFIKNPEEIQKLLNKDGKYPIEPAFDVFNNYRNIMKKQLYRETAGLLGHHGEKWWEIRSKVQQDMMRPKSAMFYIKVLEDIREVAMILWIT